MLCDDPRALCFHPEGGRPRDDRERREFAEVDDDVLGNAGTEIVLLRITAHIGEGQDTDADPFALATGLLRPARVDGEGADGALDVLERHRPEVFQGKAQLSGDVLADSFGEDDPTGLGESLQPCGDVDPFPIEITIFGDHITQVEPHAKAE
ncbi:hypothetical protein D9M70_492910 [compost metagenome]